VDRGVRAVARQPVAGERAAAAALIRRHRISTTNAAGETPPLFFAWFGRPARINTGTEPDASGAQDRNQSLSKKFKAPLTMF
ncbi:MULTISPECIES: hypothetical protein, partial [unclassified Bradyrhizobium]|uniref:hypothetical protein n=1 Tax=unclassified Bradyrhizobium TaxID=2631580 RepID=UPI0028E63429